MDKNHQIYELSDSEFLSFLYAERDREFSKFSSWGVNFWVAGVAIIGLLGYAYSQISIDYDTFKWHLFVLYSTVLGALLLSLVTIVHPLLINDRWSNKYRVTTVRANVQSTEILGKLYIAISSIMYISYLNEKNEVFWLWCVVCGVEFAIWLYVSVYGDKLIRMVPVRLQAIIVLKVRAPMHHTHAALVGFLGEKAVLYKLLGKEDEVVHSTIEETRQSLSNWVLRLDDWLMMPNHDWMSVEPQRPKQNDRLDAQTVCGIKDVVMFATSQHFPSSDKHVLEPLVGVFLMVPNHIEALFFKLQSAIEEVRRKGSLPPFSNDSFCVLSMIEVYRHLSLPVVCHLPLSQGTLSTKGTAMKQSVKVMMRMMMRSGILLRNGCSSNMLA